MNLRPEDIAEIERWMNGRQLEPVHDELLKPEEALKIIRKSKDWFYRRWGTLPFAIKVDGEIRCSRRGIDLWIQGMLEKKKNNPIKEK